MTPKSVMVPGGVAAKTLLDGQADIGLQQISEIVVVPGVTLVGPLPPDIQNETVYADVVGPGSAAPEAARAFLAIMAGLAARPVLAERSMTTP